MFGPVRGGEGAGLVHTPGELRPHRHDCFLFVLVPSAVGDAVVGTREKRGWSKAQLARKAKLSRWSVYRIESGINPQRADTLFRVAHALVMPIRELVLTWPERSGQRTRRV